ncbi:hypothetical protein ACOTI8_09960 [Achromobacter xylosoxidans]|uniref:drug:proton antiporter n=1 Tax=Alcaligenes xylosoxydans xylosoxydans TaxID=85698 RepID=UPI000332325E|nr:drug:proton antiporter [Achromobacter xylosoxidans]WPQ37719.1 hypothetical protein SLH34_12980 [Achromobacter xylosoxidans]CCH07544.1 drug:proton antiporter [Achromobacter xylosoxidans NH44784-1996]
MGSSVATTSGPVIGGWLVSLDWRWVFYLNLPVGLLTVAFLARTPVSPRRTAPFDMAGQAMATLAMGALIYGAIEAGALGIGAGPRFGARTLIVSGLVSMSAGLAVVAALPASAPVAGIATLTVLVGLAGPLVAPPVTAVLLSSVPGPLAGTASDVFNASRQVGGALAVDLFGALLAQAPSFMAGMRISLLLAAGVALVTAAMGMRLQPSGSPESLATP